MWNEFTKMKDKLLKQLCNLLEITEGHEITFDVPICIARTVFSDADGLATMYKAVGIKAHVDNGYTSFAILTESGDDFGFEEMTKWSARDLCFESIDNLVRVVRKHIVDNNLVAEKQRNYWLSVGVEQYMKSGYMYLYLKNDDEDKND